MKIMAMTKEPNRSTGTDCYEVRHVQQGDYFDIILLGFLFLFALGLRLIRLFDLDLNFDETILLLIAKSSYREIIDICKLDNFAPLYPWLVKSWITISSDAHWHRLLGAILGSLTPPLAFILGRELYDRRLGWLLGIATSLSVPLVFFSQMVRMYNIQPFWVCLSLLAFIKALQTNRWRYWLLIAFANLVGYYMYFFMVFVFFAEFFILCLRFKTHLKRYLRPFVSQLPYFFGVVLWFIPTLGRVTQVEGEFWVPPLSWEGLGGVWLFMGIGSDLRDHYALAFLLNMPFLAGFLLALPVVIRNEKLRIVLIIYGLVIAFFVGVSILGQSFFSNGYLYFLTPLYLIIVIAGWLSMRNRFLRNAGVTLIMTVLFLSLAYYYIDYYYMHDYYGFLRPIPQAEKGEGHNLSGMALDVSERLGDNEVIIHYSDPYLRVCSYYASLYYHSRSLPEHIYSKEEIAQHNGRQYLLPGEWIRSLYDLKPLPKGIWMISLNNTELFFDEAILRGEKRPKWVHEENLPLELRQAGFVPVETIKRGKVSAIHYRRETDKPAENAVEP